MSCQPLNPSLSYPRLSLSAFLEFLLVFLFVFLLSQFYQLPRFKTSVSAFFFPPHLISYQELYPLIYILHLSLSIPIATILVLDLITTSLDYYNNLPTSLFSAPLCQPLTRCCQINLSQIHLWLFTHETKHLVGPHFLQSKNKVLHLVGQGFYSLSTQLYFSCLVFRSLFLPYAQENQTMYFSPIILSCLNVFVLFLLPSLCYTDSPNYRLPSVHISVPAHSAGPAQNHDATMPSVCSSAKMFFLLNSSWIFIRPPYCGNFIFPFILKAFERINYKIFMLEISVTSTKYQGMYQGPQIQR